MKYYYFDEEVKKGTYICILCGLELNMEDGEILDLCPVCSGSKYEKVED
ncbi:hypothetical protein [Psychrilyobacter sp.]